MTVMAEDSHEEGVAGADEDARLAPGGPVGDAAVHPAVIGRRAKLPDLGIVRPQRLPGGRVDRRHLADDVLT